MNYNLNPMEHYSYYPTYEQFNLCAELNYICKDLNEIHAELDTVNQILFQLQSAIQRGLYDEIFNPNGYTGFTATTHNLNEWGNGQGMKKGRLNDRIAHTLTFHKIYLENRKSCLEYRKNYLENFLFQQGLNYNPYLL